MFAYSSKINEADDLDFSSNRKKLARKTKLLSKTICLTKTATQELIKRIINLKFTIREKKRIQKKKLYVLTKLMNQNTKHKTTEKAIKNFGRQQMNDKRCIERKMAVICSYCDHYAVVKTFLQSYKAESDTLGEIYENFLASDLAPNISFTTFKRICKDFGFKYKAIKKATVKKPIVEHRVCQYYEYLLSLLSNKRNFVGFFDTSSVSDKAFKQKGWSLPLTNCTINSSYVYSSLHVLALISNTGLFFAKLLKGNIINYDLLDFLNEVVQKIKTLQDYDNIYIVLDNSTQHKTDYIANFAKAQNVMFVFTIPHTPESNPAEFLFRYLKSPLRKSFVLPK